jgi:hypothetical protein
MSREDAGTLDPLVVRNNEGSKGNLSSREGVSLVATVLVLHELIINNRVSVIVS